MGKEDVVVTLYRGRTAFDAQGYGLKPRQKYAWKVLMVGLAWIDLIPKRKTRREGLGENRMIEKVHRKWGEIGHIHIHILPLVLRNCD